MTDSGQENPNSRETSEDETTHIAQRDSTRPLPTRPEQQPRSSWSGSSGGSSAVGSSAPQQGGAPVGQQGGANPYGPPQSSPQQGYGYGQQNPGYGGQPAQQGYQAHGYQGPQGQYNAGQQYGGQPGGPYGDPSSGQNHYAQGPQNPRQYNSNQTSGYPSAPQYGSAPQYSAQQPQQYGNGYQVGQYNSGAPQGQYGAQSPQQYSTAYPAAPQGAHGQNASSAPASAKKTTSHQLTPLEKFSPFVPAFLLFIAAFLTWATFKSGAQTVSLNGIGGNSNSANPNLGGAKSTGGWLTIVLALGLVGFAVAAILGKLKGAVVAIGTIVLSVLGLIIGLIQFANVHTVVNSSDGKGYSGTIGIGVWLTLFGGLVGAALGVGAFLSARKRGAKR